MCIILENRLEKILSHTAFLQQFKLLLVIVTLDRVSNGLKIVFQSLNQGIQLMVQCLVEQILFLCDLEQFIARLAAATKNASPSVLSRAEPLWCQAIVVFGRHVLPRIVNCWNTNDFIDGQLQLVSTIFRGQNRFTS